MRKIFRSLSVFLLILSIFLFGAIGFYNFSLPDRYYVNRGEKLDLLQEHIYTSNNAQTKSSAVLSNGGNENVSLNLFNIIPIKNVSVESTDEVHLIPSGNPFGVKMFTAGAMVVGLSDIQTSEGNICPGREADIKKGDIILAVNKKEISRNEEVAMIIENCDGSPLIFEIQRGKEKITATLTPVISTVDGKYKSGIWVRDSAAGIGTITYIDPSTSVFAGLGHAICDIDTGEVLPVGSGEVCDVAINSINKGKSGTPGELLGVFTSSDAVGNIVINNDTGIYGQLFDDFSNQKAYSLAHKQEITTGPATVLCAFDGKNQTEFDIEIASVDYNDKNQVKNMVIKVTDPELLELTGGIVQGMSGTPIIQNGKLIGAVTHVFVNDPTKGYAIFAENMYQNSKNIEASTQKKAS